jgi:hypothetical protein
MQTSLGFRSFLAVWSMLIPLCCDAFGVAQGAQRVATLHVFTHVSPLNSYGVTSTLVYGPTEAILIDTQVPALRTVIAGDIAFNDIQRRVSQLLTPRLWWIR